MSSKYRVVRVIAAGAALVIAVSGMFFVSQRSGSEISAAAVLDVCDRDGAYDLACVTETIRTVPVTQVAVFAAEFLGVLQTRPELADYCHTIMHAIGQHVADDLDVVAAGLGSVWEPCGYGLLHGVFESQPIASDLATAAGQVASLCGIDSIVSNERLSGECFHALGHSVHDRFGGLERSIPVCVAAFPTGDRIAQRIGCFSGLAMKERDEVLVRVMRGASVEPTVAGFEQVGGACRSGGAEFALACAPGFVQIATEFGSSHIRPFLEWCVSVTPEGANECFRQTGIYMGHFRVKFDSLVSSVQICAPGEPTAVQACRIGLVEGLLNRGEPRPAAVQQLCDAYLAATLPDASSLCAVARETYLVS
jgi:hypothetical protein